MSKDTETLKHDAEVTQFRFALIAPVILGLYPDASAYSGSDQTPR